MDSTNLVTDPITVRDVIMTAVIAYGNACASVLAQSAKCAKKSSVYEKKLESACRNESRAYVSVLDALNAALFAPKTQSDGIAMIAIQRKRQFRSHNDSDDDGLTEKQMAKSALVKLENALQKPSGAASYAMLLVKAGAMIAAELDRLDRADGGNLAKRLPGE